MTECLIMPDKNNYCMQAAATCITLNDELDTKFYFTEVYNVFAIQKLLTCRSGLSADLTQLD